MELAEIRPFEPQMAEIDLFTMPDAVGVGEPSVRKQKPYIAGHVTDGSSTFTFKVNNQNVTVPVDANGNWKWKIDRAINVNADFSNSSTITEIGIFNLFNAVTANNVLLVFHQNVWNMIMREIDMQGSPIQVAYQNMIDNYDVTIANVSFDAEIEYLGFNGTQYIDTGFRANTTTTRAETELQVTDFSTTCGLFGSRNNSTSTNTDSCNVFVLDNNRFRLDWVDGTTNVIATNIVTTEKYIISITRGMATVNDATFTGTNIDSIDQNYNFYIGTYNRAGETSPYLFRGRFYWFKIYSNNQLVRDFIPVRKGTTGYLYDKVSGNLFGNSGTGDFILGNDK